MSTLVEKELFRKKLYDNISQWLCTKLIGLKQKEIYNILLRYIFNKNITREKDDDPIFITSKSALAKLQFEKDIQYNKLNVDSEKLLSELEDRLKIASDKVKQTPMKRDKPIEIIPSKNEEATMVYKCKKYSDISNLAERYPEYVNYALALNIRYNYIHLSNHGLARNFKEMGFLPDDNVLEGFASAFNHYFDNFCSAFPDLEGPFGSKGSFFTNNEWNYSKIFINPPFDEVLMTQTIEKVYSVLETNNFIEFCLTIPNWNEYPELDKLKESDWTKIVVIYKKGDLPFIDYMNKKNIIYPCEIAEIEISNIKN